MISRRRLAASSLLLPVAARAQDAWPNRPVRMIIPYAPGGPTDAVGRVIFEEMSRQLGQRVTPDNRSGAGIVTGADVVAKAQPDGYTMLYGTLALPVAPAMFRSLPFDPLRDFVPVALLAQIPSVFVVNPATVPARTMQEFIAYVRERPDQIPYASPGTGSVGHMSSELFLSEARLRMPAVQYRGNGPALPDLLAGRVAFELEYGPNALALLADGRLKALAVSASRRLSQLPNVPSAAEVGLPGWEAYTWHMIWAPRGTPPAIVQRMNAAANRAVQDPAVGRRLEGDGVVVVGDSTPESAERYMRAEVERWVPLLRAAGIEPS